MKTVAIIGGGASGIAAAIEALRTVKERSLPAEIIVYEKLLRVCKKILVTGNGRCNLCARDIGVKNYRGDKKLINAVLTSRFSDTKAFFDSLGLLTFEEDGRIYPKSQSASSVADALRFTALALGCKIVSDTPVTEIEKCGDGFLLNGGIFANAVVLACGGAASPAYGSDGSGYTLLKSLGHGITEIRPALAAVKCSDPFFKALKGIRADASAVLSRGGKTLFKDEGEVQFTQYGLSGIPILNLSGLIDTKNGTDYKITLDLCRELSYDGLCGFLEKAVKQNKPSAADVLSGLLPKRLGEVVLTRTGVSPAEKLGTENISKIAHTIKGFGARAAETAGFSKAQVTSGGIDSKELDLASLSSRIAGGLYVCGELLDADGLCGGYNLHFAWTSGRTAGFNAVTGIFSNDKN